MPHPKSVGKLWGRWGQSLLLTLAVSSLGCSADWATKKTQKVELQLTVITRAADAIDAKVEEARGTNSTALVIVSTAATRPTVPAETRADLSVAKDQMARTEAVLVTVPAQTRIIRGGAVEQASTAKDAIKGQVDAEGDLSKERDHYLGYKTRRVLWVLLFTLPVIGLIVFAVKVAGGGPILSVVGEIVGGLFRLLWRAIRGILIPLGHLVSLGAAKLADKVNQEWEDEAAKQARLAALHAVTSERRNNEASKKPA